MCRLLWPLCLCTPWAPDFILVHPVFRRMVRGDPRAIVEYRDLDAPDDVDFF